jgi:hypothetical protein
MRGLLASAALLVAAAMTSPLRAQTICPDGKTFTGACVKAELGESVRKQVFVSAQPKISYTAPPVLPSEDGTYSIPRDYHELRAIYGVGATTATTAAGVAVCVPTRANPC